MKKPNTITSHPELNIHDRIAVLPGLLMCSMVVLMLFLDILLPGMADNQYSVFQNLFKVLNVLITIGGLCSIILSLYSRNHTSNSINNDHAKHNITFICFGIFALCIIISTCISGLDHDAIHGVPYRDIGVFHMLIFLIVYMGMSMQIKREALANFILKYYMCSSSALALFVFFDKFVGAIPAFRAKKELSAIFFNGNHYGYFLTMAILIGIGYYLHAEGRESATGGLCAIINAFAIALNQTAGCIVAVIAIIIIESIVILISSDGSMKKVMIMWTAILVLAASGFFLVPGLWEEAVSLIRDVSDVLSGKTSDSIGHNRMKLWKITAGYISARPWFGYGCEGIWKILYAETGRADAHNEILTYAAYYGIPGGVAFTTGCLSAFINHLRSRHARPVCSRIAALAAAGYFMSSLFGVAMFYTAPFFFIFIGISIRELSC